LKGIDSEQTHRRVVLDDDARDASPPPTAGPRYSQGIRENYHTVGPAKAKDGSVELIGWEIEVIGFALRVVSVFIIPLLPWVVDGWVIAAWSSPEGGVRHSSSDVAGDD
jgi:hypothetical protein